MRETSENKLNFDGPPRVFFSGTKKKGNRKRGDQGHLPYEVLGTLTSLHGGFYFMRDGAGER